jgi:Ca-activated chloride channel homolog
MKRIGLLILMTAFSILVFGQNERKFIRNGNKLFMEAVRDTSRLDTTKFSNAETEYRKALNKKPTDLKWNFNLADALYKQKRFDEAAGKFNDLGEKLQTPEEKARAYHNLGNSELMQKKLDESIESYKDALRNNPNDIETKYNLAYAQMLKKKKEQQQKQQNKNNDQNKDKNKDQNKQDNKNDQNKDKQDQKNKQDQQNKNKQNQDQNKNQQQQQQPQNKISKENAEQLLQALQNDERKIQDKVKKAQAAKAKKVVVEKEW